LAEQHILWQDSRDTASRNLAGQHLLQQDSTSTAAWLKVRVLWRSMFRTLSMVAFVVPKLPCISAYQNLAQAHIQI
jgi:hypothetical protein